VSNFILQSTNKNHIFRLVNSIAKDARQKSLQNPNSIIQYNDDNGIIRFAYNGSRISFLDSAIMSIDDEEAFAQLLGDLWLDIDFQNTQNEGGVSFPTNKKPEALVKRIIDLFTSEGDIVLDSFLGSGTTAAVAQKMQRRYIGIEMGEHAYTHCKIRLDSVIDGTDQSGISRKIGWQGGGGYKFYELAPTLIVQDKYGNPVFSDKYNAEMLVAAVAKINGFYYAPDSENFWKQGFSQDNSYIYVTTQYLTAAMLDGIAAELSPMENLLICSPAFDIGLGKRYDNINVRKIPQSVLSKCEFGADNYNLNIVDAPVLDEEEWEND